MPERVDLHSSCPYLSPVHCLWLTAAASRPVAGQHCGGCFPRCSLCLQCPQHTNYPSLGYNEYIWLFSISTTPYLMNTLSGLWDLWLRELAGSSLLIMLRLSVCAVTQCVRIWCATLCHCGHYRHSHPGYTVLQHYCHKTHSTPFSWCLYWSGETPT